MNTLDRFRAVLASSSKSLENDSSSDITDLDDEDLAEEDLAKETAFGRKLGNFSYKFVPEIPPLKIRGENYINDGIKIPSGKHKFDCVGFDIYAHERAFGGITENWKDGEFTTLQTVMKSDRFKLVVHFLVPGTPNMTTTLYFLARPNVLDDGSKFAELFRKFVKPTLPDAHGKETKEAADAYRTKTFKFIPRFVKGASMAKRVAGEKPAIICKKIPSKFFVGEDYLEIDFDVSRSRIAALVLGLVKKQLRGMILDMIFLLEGKNKAELPEEIISGIRLFNPSLHDVQVMNADGI